MRSVLICFISVVLMCDTAVFAQSAKRNTPNISVEQALKKFPGLDRAQMQQLMLAGKQYAIPLPTWLPEGFKVEKVIAKINSKSNAEDKVLEIFYIKAMPGGKKQYFVIEAGIDGIGDLPYMATDSINTRVGYIYLCYEPTEEGKQLKNYVRTDWFDCDGTAWAYGSNEGISSRHTSPVMISRIETRRIIGSLQKL